ncbi:MAG: glutaredoxin domain-containing protein [Peptoniphilus harei]|nr:glutaredoxin domain-containing protein [Peptoniphilus harei]
MASDEKMAFVSGENVSFDGRDLEINAYLINRSNYVKIRDVAALLKDTPAKFDLAYDNEKQSVIISKGKNYSDSFIYKESKLKEERIAKETRQKIVDDKGQEIELKGYFIDGYNYFRLRDLGKVLDFGVAYDFKDQRVLLSSDNPKLADVFEEDYFTPPVNKIKTKGGEENISFLIYGFDECPYCQKLKAYLDGKGIKYLSRDIRDCEGKKEEVFKEFYGEFPEFDDRVYYPTHIMTLEKDGKKISKCVVGFEKENYDEIFRQIEDNTYFVEK